MEHCIKTGVERKLRKHAAIGAQQPQLDFIAKLAQTLLFEQLDAYLRDNVPKNSVSAAKGLLLYEQSHEFILDLTKLAAELDQVPFTAALLPAEDSKKMLPDKGYQILLSNLAFNWVDAAEFIRLMQQLLLPGGRCWFSAFGDQTAMRSKSLLAELDPFPHFSDFYNLQDIGDALLGSGFKEVVVESNSVELEYQSAEVLIADASKIFGVNMHPKQRKSLSPAHLRDAFSARVEQVIQAEGRYVEKVEIILAHAKMPIVEDLFPVTMA